MVAVLGGPEFIVRYPNGDESQYVINVFECAVRAGSLRADGDETLEARYWRAAEAVGLPLSPWLRHVLATFYANSPDAYFEPARWWPPPDG